MTNEGLSSSLGIKPRTLTIKTKFMDNETLPQDSQPDVDESTKDEQDGGENVSDSLSLEDINTLLKKDFKDIETAKKSLLDTQSYVGKKVEKDPADAERLDNLEKQLNESNFYRDNPIYNNEETKNLIRDLGGNPAEVVEKDSFKTIFEKVSAYDKSQESKSVLHNSSRLGKVSNKMDEATEAMDKAQDAAAKGNMVEAMRLKDKADENAVQSVVDSFAK